MNVIKRVEVEIELQGETFKLSEEEAIALRDELLSNFPLPTPPALPSYPVPPYVMW